MASAQTVIARQAPAGSTVELVVNTTKVGAATADAGGDARLPFDLEAQTSKTGDRRDGPRRYLRRRPPRHRGRSQPGGRGPGGRLHAQGRHRGVLGPARLHPGGQHRRGQRRGVPAPGPGRPHRQGAHRALGLGADRADRFRSGAGWPSSAMRWICSAAAPPRATAATPAPPTWPAPPGGSDRSLASRAPG